MNIDELAYEAVPDRELPIAVTKDLMNNPDNFYKMAFEFQQIMMVYESAIKQIETKLDILNKENKVSGRRNPIETVKSRVKTPQSIAGKLEKRHLPVTFESMVENLHDIAGVRVICPYISDIYSVRDMLLKQPDITLLEEKDYIKNPKESGYRSLHLVIEVPVYLSTTTHHVKVEIQLRTIAMDFWACLEHELHYKTTTNVPESIRRELFRVAETIAMTDREMEEIAIELQNMD
ncbi:MAG: GTP pyrophosphokinase family protein [Treponema sp.]|uniref:GTP pyrophosphokinase n=1 Tax=Treponema sp. TaxID=166 RepID=UPI002A91EDB0|nr:GTP pyrophosphokinase family protein [Treponema sp.]MDY6398765.1 GTP pyrophosphokinase family protein [Treponema sp.]